jgi:hypothetical protein
VTPMRRVADGVVCDTDDATEIARIGWPGAHSAAPGGRPQKRRETLYRTNGEVPFLHTEIWGADADSADTPPRLETIDMLTDEDATAWLAKPGHQEQVIR